MTIFSIEKIVQQVIPDLSNATDIHVTSIYGGGNNRSYLVKTKNHYFFAKQYFQNSLGKRNRIATEYAFSSFLWKHQIRCIPKPIGQDLTNSVAFYEYIDGRKLAVTEINDTRISQAINFVEALNNKRIYADDSLQNASEACFSLIDHLQLVEQRIEKLQTIKVQDDIDQHAEEFVNKELINTWDQLKNTILSRVSKSLLHKEIDKILSPSDFGFHNVLMTEDQQLRFFDFEYAGWDDPAKLVCDFFCQPALPVSMHYFAKFANAIANFNNEPALALERIKVLFPVIRLKWCCIALNCFVPHFKDRKTFVRDISEEFRFNQIAIAKNMLASVIDLQKEGG